MNFPPEAYSQGERFQLEKRRLFTSAWLPFCAAGQLAAAGSFVSHTLGGWPMVAIRGDDGVARGFRNVCRHQGMPVVEQPTGQCAALRCRYHGWTYDLTGALTAAPPPVAPADPAAPIHHLDALALAEAGGMMHLRGRDGDDTAPPDVGVDGLDFVAVGRRRTTRQGRFPGAAAGAGHGRRRSRKRGGGGFPPAFVRRA
ncbi:MAG: Rieske (2Fe-2S) protein [Proteobacteria bacterium]|nr:Rieske (2Fe-2S) protein [Pseudomonadota bacterium]